MPYHPIVASTAHASRPVSFMLLVYRVPAKPTANRVYVWRVLKKMGAVYLQQSVCVFPHRPDVLRELRPVLDKITASAGEYHLLPLRHLDHEEEAKVVAQFIEQSTRHYAEIVENCEVNFAKEIEFETFRGNFTYEEAEEIRAEYDKIVAWYEHVRQRDWFGAPNEGEARDWLERSARMLDEFEARVFAAQEGGEASRPIGAAHRRIVRRRPTRPLAAGSGESRPSA